MSNEPYTATADAQLKTACLVMADRKLGCALVMEGEHPVGIFTHVDALRALAALLAEREES